MKKHVAKFNGYRKVQLDDHILDILNNLKNHGSNKHHYILQRLAYVRDFHELVKDIRKDLNIPDNGLDKEALNKYIANKGNGFLLGGSKFYTLDDNYSVPEVYTEKIKHFLKSYKHIFELKVLNIGGTLIFNAVLEYILSNNITPINNSIILEKIESKITDEYGEEDLMDMYSMTFNSNTTKSELIDYIEKNFKTVKEEISRTSDSNARISSFRKSIADEISVWNAHIDLLNGDSDPEFGLNHNGAISLAVRKRNIDLSENQIERIKEKMTNFNTPHDYYENTNDSDSYI